MEDSKRSYDVVSEEASGGAGDVPGEMLLEEAVSVSGKERKLKLTSDGLQLIVEPGSCDGKKNSDKDVLELQWCDVLRAQACPDTSANHQHASLSLSYIQQMSNKKLQTNSVEIKAADGNAEKRICMAINEQIKKVEGRPKKIFVVVNPIGGAGKGRQIYQEKVFPLLELAHIHTTVVVTERAKHALEIGETQDFSSYDGLLLVGGDGLFQEILQGLFLQTQKSAGVDSDDPDAKLVKPTIPIGLVPGGTGNGVVSWCNDGVNDAKTAVLRILRGKILRAQIFTVYSRNKFVCTCGLLFAYGLFGDVIKRSDELRWMKRARYPYCMLSLIVKKRRHFKCSSFEYCLLEQDTSQNGEVSGAGNCGFSKKWITPDSKQWPTVGIFCFIANILQKPNNHVQIDPFGAGFRLYLDAGASTFGVFKSMMVFATGKSTNCSVEKMTTIDNVEGFRFKVGGSESADNLQGARAKEFELERYMDIDGEALTIDVPEVELRAHSAFIPMFACRPTAR